MDRDAAIDRAAAATEEWSGVESVSIDARPIDGGWRCWQVATRRTVGAFHVLVRDDGTTVRCPAALDDDGAADRLARTG